MSAKLFQHRPMPSGPRTKLFRAFTRVELAAVIAGLALLSVIALPLLGTTRGDSERAACFNNLRLIGRGMQIWAGEHNQRLPWWTPTTEGGEFIQTGTSAGGARPGAAWIEYAFVSNELVTPKILACPSDASVKRADEWSQFTSGTFRNSALSYPVHLHAFLDAPRSWLSADRNLRAVAGAGCSTGVNNTHRIDTALVEWTNAVHGVFGHVVLTDGSMEFTSSQQLKGLLVPGDNGSMHFLNVNAR